MNINDMKTRIPPTFEKEPVEEARFSKEFLEYKKKYEAIWNNMTEMPDLDTKEYEIWNEDFERRNRLCEELRTCDKIPGTLVTKEFDECSGKKRYVWRWYDEEYYCEMSPDRKEKEEKLKTKEEFRKFFSDMFGLDVSDENPIIECDDYGPICRIATE